MSSVAESLLAGVFLLCGFSAVFGLVVLKLELERGKRVFLWVRRAVLAAAVLSAVVLILLTVAFLRDDFSNVAVSQYSSVDLPFFYKLSAVWAGSTGSLLLWLVASFVLFALWLMANGNKRYAISDLKFNSIALCIGSGVCLVFSGLLLFIEKPFASCPVTLDDGAGLNPLLQNFWMITHPPLLFVGYSAFLIPFVIVLACVFSRRTQDSYVYGQVRRWLLFGICFLSLGIATGARWSYVELGWGGYWAWDPVENASLLPWFAAVAALHSLAAVRISDRFKLWTVALVPMPFILCLVATFITRSGILASVHAFSQNVMFSALLGFIGCCLLLLTACIRRALKDASIVGAPRKSTAGLDKSEILLWANLIFIFTAVVIGAATFWPIVSPVFTNSNAKLVLTRTFYDRVITVAGILMAFLVGLASLADFQRRRDFIVRVLGSCAVGVACFGLLFELSRMTLVLSLACGICAASGAAVLMKLRFNLKARVKVGGGIAHLGLLLLVAAAGMSSNEQNVQAQLAKGEGITLGGYSIVYDSFEHKSSAGITMVGPKITVAKNGSSKNVWPHNNLYPSGKSTSEVAVRMGLFEDIYISFDGVTRQDLKVIITAKLKPMMFWLWLASVLIVAGSALAMFERPAIESQE